MDFLIDADDDYLVAVSNKGILKRAYKDLEGAEISAEYSDKAAAVTVSGEICTIVNPVSESKCTCPSRSICRHIVTAVLWLRKNLSDRQSDNNTEKQTESKFSEQFYSVLSNISPADLKKIMKKTFYTSFVIKAKNEQFPDVEEIAAGENSVVMVKFPETGFNVRLMMPLDRSICTCRTQSLCKHKAAAIMAWQLKKGIIKLSDLTEYKQSSSDIDVDLIHDTAQAAKKYLSKLLSDGLVRAAEDLTEKTEMYAVMCHNARMADNERNLREIGSRLNGYINHSPAFKTEHLFSQIMETIILFNKIINSQDESELKQYLGEFKSTYLTEQDIEIIPIAARDFSSLSGYEGEIFYFVNKTKHIEYDILTYSAVRPTFYQTIERTAKHLPAPWKLPGGVDELLKYELKLYTPKLSGNKLSSSGDTAADIITAADLNQPAVRDLIYTDFYRMVNEKYSKQIGSNSEENERLVLISPKCCTSSGSDEITQTHTVTVEDSAGRVLSVKAYYKSGSANFFARFSEVGEMMLKHPEKRYTIFGNLYIEESGRFCIYPIAIFDNIDINDTKAIEDLPKIRDYSVFFAHFAEVRNALCDIIQCGINSYDLYERIKEYSVESGKMGLLMFSENLDLLYRKLLERNHTYSNDNSEIVDLLTDLYSYISLGFEQIKLSKAIAHLQKR